MRRAFVASLLAAAAAGCASAPPAAAIVPTIPFDTKMSWVLRFEDARILRDAVAPIPPPPPPGRGKSSLLPPPPPPPPDLLRLLTDSEARVRRRAALAAGRVGLAEAAPNLAAVLKGDSDPEVRQMAAFALGLLGDNTQVEPLRAALADASPLVAGRAAEALASIGDTASAAAIGRMVAGNLAAVASLMPVWACTRWRN